MDPAITPEARKDLCAEVRDSIEVVHSQEYPLFLDNFLPACKAVLCTITKPQQTDNVIHQTRALILEILNRLPHSEVMKLKYLQVFALAMDVLQKDNEENAVTAIHIIFDLHKNYRHHLAGQVQPFLDFVHNLYESFANTVKALLLTQKAPEQQAQGAGRRMSTSSQSFKVMTECPLLVMFVFQLYPAFIKTNIQKLLPLMLRAIEVEVPPRTVALLSSRTIFQEFIAAQVKTLSFLAFLLKQFPDLMKPDEMSLPRSVVKLLQSCPGESVAIRKELLVATRHILGSPFRQGFFGQIDLLLKPRILVGTGRGAADTLRPLAYSFLAELVHCVRLNLTVPQLEKIITIFSTNLHDSTFSYTLQTSAVRLLLNLIEGIPKIDNGNSSKSSAARDLLMRILKTMVAKYVNLGEQVPRLMKSIEELRARPDPLTAGTRLCEAPVGDPMKEVSDFKVLLKTLTLGLKTLIWSSINLRVSQFGTANGSGPLIAENNGGSGQANAAPGPGPRAGLLEEECEIVGQLLEAGKSCFLLYRQPGQTSSSIYAMFEDIGERPERRDHNRDAPGKDQPEVVSNIPVHGPAPRYVVATLQEEKEMFDQFAQIFTVLDIRSFQDIFGLRVRDLFQHMVENPSALMVPQHFLANRNISKYFADILLNFLVDNLEILDVAIPKTLSVLSHEENIAHSFLKLVKILFASLTLFPSNEPVLRLHIGLIVRRCLRRAAKTQDPHNYLQMLRALFKTLTNNKSDFQFDMLYRDFMPLVEPLFSGLLALYEGPSRQSHSDLIVELCLMIPARPSTIFPYLDLQIKPIVWALDGDRENMHYGLRTLEFWVDMLQPTYLETLIVRVEPDLTRSLCRLLRPPLSVTFGATSLRILGKLGSRARNRTGLKMPFRGNVEIVPVQNISLEWVDGSEVMLETDSLVRLSVDAVLGKQSARSAPADAEHKSNAWKFLYTCLCPVLGVEEAESLQDGSFAQRFDWALGPPKSVGKMNTDQTSRMVRSKEPMAKLVKQICIALVSASALPELAKYFVEDTSPFWKGRSPAQIIPNLSRYFALLAVQECERRLRLKQKPSSNYDPPHCRGNPVLKHTVFLDAIVDVLSLEGTDLYKGGLRSLEAYLHGLLDYCVTSKEVKPEGDHSAAVSGKAPVSSGGETSNSQGDVRALMRGDKMDIDVENPPISADSMTKRRDAEMKGTAATDNHATGVTNAPHDEHVLANTVAAIVDRLGHCCYQRTWNAKRAGTKGLELFISQIPENIFALPYFAPIHLQILRALLFVIRDSSLATEEGTIERGRKVLQKLLRICFRRREGDASASQPLAQPFSKVLREATIRLTVDLTCESASARETARQCLTILGEALGCDIADILTPVKEHILRPLQQRSIRQHPFPVQVGYMEAAIFCLQLERSVLASELFAAPLRSVLLSEVIAISEDPTVEKLTEAEEGIRHKLVENKLIQTVVVKYLVQLRRRAVDLLCNVSLHCCTYLQEATNDDLFRRIISSFFKNLQSRDLEIVESAKLGLKQAISKHQKPKELLQQNLRPILGNLADYKKLSIPYLQGLSRVLELFSHWFNVNLGEKLLEHLQRWTEPEKLAQLKRWSPGTEARVGAAILDLFHLLPPAASRFLDKIVYMVIRLESVLTIAGPGVAHLGLKSAKAASTSPYREPLLKYCNQHASAAATFFLRNLGNDMMRQLFFVMIRATESTGLRKDLMDNTQRLVSQTFLSVEGMGSQTLHVISLIDLLSRHKPEWLGSDPDFMAKLSTYWKKASNFSDTYQSPSSLQGRVQEIRTLAEIFIRYFTHFPEDISVLFDLLPVFTMRTSCDFTFVKDFLKHSVTKPGLSSSRRDVVSQFLTLFQDKQHSQERKAHALQHIVTPMIIYHLTERKELFSNLVKERRRQEVKSISATARPGSHSARSEHNLPLNESTASDSRSAPPTAAVAKDNGGTTTSSVGEVLNSSANRVAASPEKIEGRDGPKTVPPDAVLDATMIQKIMKELLDQPDEVLKKYDEPLSAELLRLATILIQYMPTEVGRFRKELIKFGWNHLKREDSIAKQWAFVNVSRFFEAYPAPVKIILQVYVALLRACQGDGKDLVQQALDILTPALPRRLIHNPVDHKYPIWIRYTKKILMEEGHSIPNLVHIWQLIARHPNLFYVARAQFVPIMVNSLSRIGLNPAATPENRRLSLDLVELIVKWERRRRLKYGDIKEDAEVDQNSTLDGSVKKRGRGVESDPVSNCSAPSNSETNSQKHESVAEPPTKTMKNNDAQAVPVAASQNRATFVAPNREAEDFKPTTAMVDVMVNFLVQIPFRPMDRREGPLVSKKSVILLKSVLELWPEATIRLSFLEKLLSPEKAATGSQTAPGSKPTANTGNVDNNTADPKGVQKNESIRNEKAELARMRRHAIRSASLTAALSLASVLTKAQGKKFVVGNSIAIRALVLPSITEKGVHTAKQFASLLEDLLKVCPRATSGSVPVATEDTANNSTDTKSKSESENPKGNAAALGASSVLKPDTTSKLSGQDEIHITRNIFKLVHEAILICMKATDAVTNQCGLLVLRTFSNYAPEEFVKYQDLITKCLHRMTKENLNTPQTVPTGAGSSAGAGSSNASRGGNAADRNAPNASASNSTRPTSGGSAVGIDESHKQDTRPGRNQASQGVSTRNTESHALILCVSLLGDNIMTLESGHRKTLFHLLWALIDRCVQFEILLEIVRVVGCWVLWKPSKVRSQAGHKEPLTSKEKVQFLNKMVVFERIEGGKGSQELLKAYLSIILKICGGSEKRSDLCPKLERAFMLGMKAQDSYTRQEFFKIYDESISPALPIRLTFAMAKQEWEYLSDTLWIKHASEMLLAAAKKNKMLRCDNKGPSFPEVLREHHPLVAECDRSSPVSGRGYKVRTSNTVFVRDECLTDFYLQQTSCNVGVFVAALRSLIHSDPEVAYQAWVELLPKAWAALSTVERCNLEKAIPQLLTKEYHQIQAPWPRNNIQALLDAIVKCEPLPPLRAELVFHLGSRWNAWHSALRYLEKRNTTLSVRYKSGANTAADDRPTNKVKAELEDIADAQAELYRQLNERDYLAGIWKERTKSATTRKALSYEQLGQYAYAQDVYSSALKSNLTSNDSSTFFNKSEQPGKAEICFWEERWIECARKLCQWDVLTEFSRVVVNSELLHECLWRVPDWSALKELLIKNPVEDGPQLKLYQAYVQLQENKLELADSFIMQGYQRALERYCALPESADLDASGKTLVQFQQLVELQESGRILGELNALSRHGSGSINVEQKIDNVRLILNTWRERLPSQHEPLSVWNDVLTWRNHVHAVVVNVLEALKEAASAKVAAAQNSSGTGSGGSRIHGNGLNAQTPQVQAAAAIAQALPQQVLVMGVNETAWNVHRFAKACRKQGFPDMALYALQKLYPFGTMELTEYFVKTKETARSFMSNPKCVENGTEYGLHELNRCNMDHFNARQKAQLFTIRGKLCASLGRDDDAVEAYSVALSTASDVGSAWLAWGLHCDKLQKKLLNGSEMERSSSETTSDKNTSLQTGLEWREAAVNCFLQAVRFGSRKSRSYLPRVLRLLTLDVQTRLHMRKTHDSSEEGKSSPPVLKDSNGGNPAGTSPLESNSQSSTAPHEKTTRSTLGGNEALASQGVSRVVSQLIPDIPVWMWLPWIHQLILMLSRTEASFIRSILVRLAQEYPQAIFFPLRAFMEERKAIDRPEKFLSIDALKMGRPNTPALLPTATTAQANAVRRAQVAKENAHRAQRRYLSVQKEMQKLDSSISIAGSQAGTPEHGNLVAQKGRLKEDLLNTRRVLDKYVKDYHTAQQQQKQSMENAAGGQVPISGNPSSSKKEGESSLNSATELPLGSQTGVAEKRRIPTGSSGKQGGESVTAPGSESTVRSGPGFLDHPFAHADFVMAHFVKSHQLLYLEMDRIAVDLSIRFKPLPEEHLLSLMNALLHRCYQNSVKAGREVALSLRSALEEISKMCFGPEAPESKTSISDLKTNFEAELAPQTAKNFPTQLEPFIERLRRWQHIFQRRVDSMPEFLKMETVTRALVEVNSSNVEVFGQYFDAESCEPSTERYTKIIRFGADVRIVRRQSGSARGIQVIGSNGKSYHFLLETGVNAHAHAAEDRTAQVCRLLNSFIFSKNSEAHRRLVHLNAPIFVSTGARTRLMSDDPSLSSLADGLERFLRQKNETVDDPLMAFRTLASEAYGRRRAEKAEHASRAESIAARVDAYHAVCESRVPETCLSAWVKANMPSATSDFMFRKRLAETLGPASLVSYALAIGARRPQNILFSWSTGAVYNLHMRSLISSRGILESDEAVPFRLTRNIRRLLGPFGLEGPFYGSLVATMQALLCHEELLRLFLDVVMRDELVGWVVTKSESLRKAKRSGSVDQGSGTLPFDCQLLESRLSATLDAVVNRLTLRNDAGKHDSSPGQNIDVERVTDTVQELISRACQPENLAQMEASWQAWY